MRFNILFLFPVALITAIVIMHNPNRAASNASFIIPVTLQDSLPESFIRHVNPQLSKGKRIIKSPTESITFYEYQANHKEVLKQLSLLPFATDNLRADTHTRLLTSQEELGTIQSLLSVSQEMNDFTITTNKLSEFNIYECIKSPQHHFVLLHRESDSVIHIIHQS